MSATAAIGDVETFRKIRPYLELLRLLWGLEESAFSGATYAGINAALHFAPGKYSSSYTHAVRLAKGAAQAGWCEVSKSGVGPGSKAIVRLTDDGRALCRHLFAKVSQA